MGSDKSFDSAVLAYLSEKYDTEFKIVKSGMEFNGNDGTYFHAVCTGADYADRFSVYCYPESDKSGDRIIVDETEHVIVDEFAEVVFQDKIQHEIEQLVDADVFVRCQVEFSNYFISKKEYESGFATCIGDSELYSHVTVYLVGDAGRDMTSYIEPIEDYCLKLAPYRGYMYFATAVHDMDSINKHFSDNADRFDVHMDECDEIQRVEFSLIRRGEGIAKRSVEKE